MALMLRSLGVGPVTYLVSAPQGGLSLIAKAKTWVAFHFPPKAPNSLTLNTKSFLGVKQEEQAKEGWLQS